MHDVRHIALDWRGDLRFEGESATHAHLLIDGDGADAPSPMHYLLLAAASCSASDVVLILRRMRVSFDALRIELAGTRSAEVPGAYAGLRFVYHVRGARAAEAGVRRAIELSLAKYCPVVRSLDPAIHVGYELHLDDDVVAMDDAGMEPASTRTGS